MWKENGKPSTLSIFLDCLFQRTEISYMRDASSGDKKISGSKLLPQSVLRGGVFLEETSCRRYVALKITPPKH
jgi:hypothetical protein